MDRFNTECWGRVSLEGSCRFWRDVIESTTETGETRSFASENRYGLAMFSKEADGFSTGFLPKYWTEVWESWRTDLRPGFGVLSTSPPMLEKSGWFAWWAGIIPEVSRGSRMAQVLIWGCRYWRSCWGVDWFPDSSIDAITVVRDRGWFAMANRYVFGPSLEQIGWFQCRCSEKGFHWYGGSGPGF